MNMKMLYNTYTDMTRVQPLDARRATNASETRRIQRVLLDLHSTFLCFFNILFILFIHQCFPPVAVLLLLHP